MFPISSTTLSAPNAANFPLVTPTAAAAAVNASTVTPVGSAIDTPAQASVTVDLSPVANFLMTVSQSQQQITQLQAAVANGDDPQEAAVRADTLNDATQNVVNAFNLLPSVDFDQTQLRGPSLLNSLVESLNRQSASQDTVQQQSAAQSLAQNLSRIGVTLQPPPLSDAAGGLSLDNEILRASFNTDNESTTSTLQNTLDTFSELATRFAERLSAAGSGALAAQQAATQTNDLAADQAADRANDLATVRTNDLATNQANDIAADAQQQASAAQVAAVQAATVQTNPLQGNPALAAAIAAYNITDPALLGAGARVVQSTISAVPPVTAVSSTARTRGVGNGQ